MRTQKLEDLAGAFQRLGPAPIAAAMGLFVAQALAMSWRWHRIVHLLGGRLPMLRAVEWIFVGLFFNQALPSSVGGDAVRVWLIHRDGTAKGVALSSVVVERLTGVVTIALLVTACLPAVWDTIGPGPLRTALLAIGPVALAGLLVLTFVGPRVLARVPRLANSGIGRIVGDLHEVLASPTAAFEITAWGAVAGLLAFMAAFAIGRSMGLQVSMPVYVCLVGGAVLLSVLPISLGGWGLRELSMVALFGAVGVKAEEAMTLSIAYGVLALVVALPGGLLWLRAGGGKPRALAEASGQRGQDA